MKARTLVLSALSIALLAVSALISIPIGAVPITLQVAVVILIALIATPSQVLIALGGYIALGALGLPIFSGGRGGLGVIAGPTGGFLWGFLIGAILAVIIGDLFKRTDTIGVDVLKAAIVIVVMYACGWAQLVFVAGMTPTQAFFVGIAPFIVFDIIKGIVAIIVARPLRSALAAQGTMRGDRA